MLWHHQVLEQHQIQQQNVHQQTKNPTKTKNNFAKIFEGAKGATESSSGRNSSSLLVGCAFFKQKDFYKNIECNKSLFLFSFEVF